MDLKGKMNAALSKAKAMSSRGGEDPKSKTKSFNISSPQYIKTPSGIVKKPAGNSSTTTTSSTSSVPYTPSSSNSTSTTPTASSLTKKDIKKAGSLKITEAKVQAKIENAKAKAEGKSNPKQKKEFTGKGAKVGLEILGGALGLAGTAKTLFGKNNSGT